jgi:hypothetical protein
MGNHCICIATLLLSLTGGMFLLAKTKKDVLGTFFNVVSWFIIVVSLLAMICCGIRCVAGKYCDNRAQCGSHEMMGKGGDGYGGMGTECHQNMNMGMHHGMGCCQQEGCAMNKMSCGHNEDMGMNCCKMEKGKMECVKDSVVIKK